MDLRAKILRVTYVAILSSGMFACGDIPPTVMLEISSAIDQSYKSLTLTAFGPQGRQVGPKRIPENGAPSLPSSVVLYPPESLVGQELRILLVGDADKPTEVATSIEPKAATQFVLKLVLDTPRADTDKDGVPDHIDNCPKEANAEQKPCAKKLSAADAGAPSN